jgi:hypothetical protein
MNERIRELYTKALSETGGDGEEAMVEKFAKLIVNECLDMMAQRQYEGIDELWSVDKTMMKATIDIVEHFGIEE